MKFQLTTEWIGKTFDKYNEMYWGGKLRRPTFQICHTKTLLGQFCFGNGQWKMRISDMFDRSETDYINTILHESIHVYIRQNNIRDTRRHHGRVFYAEADRINRYGWHIARTDSVAGCGLTVKADIEYDVAAFKDKNGKYFLMCMNHNKVAYFKKQFERYPEFYKEWIIFKSHDDKKYASFCKCTKSCRGRFISASEFDEIKEFNEGWTVRKAM